MSILTDASSLALRGISSCRPLNAALALVSYSVVLVVLSAVVDTWDDERLFEGVMQSVGYSQTLNWAWAFTLIFPVFVFFLFRAAHAADSLPNRLAAVGMLVDENGSPHDRAAKLAASKWTTIKKRHARWWLLVTAVGVLFTTWEWVVYSLLPLISGANPRENEIDWSVKFAQDPSLAARAINAAFSFLVFLQQIVLISMIGYLLYLMLSFSALLSDLRGRGAVRLVPSVSRCGKDRRLGFEELVAFLIPLLFSIVLMYLHLFLSRVWNAYLHPGQGEPVFASVWELVSGPLFRGMEENDSAGGVVVDRFLEYAQALGATNFSGVAVSLGGIILIVLSVLFLFYSLRHAAQDARSELLAMTKSRAQRDCLEEMKIWPLKYPGVNSMLALAFLGALSILAYRLGIYFAGLLLLLALTQAVTRLSSSR